MKVEVNDIQPEGLTVSFTDGAAAPGDLGPQVEAITEPPRAELRLERLDELVTAQGSYAAGLVLSCSRCLGPMPFSLEGEVDWSFRPLPGEAPDEQHLAGEEMDLSFYRDGVIDLAQALRDELGLALPMAPLCRTDCPGLCPVCGKPLQEGRACCASDNVDPRWAKLAQLKKE
ncbi:MAG: YceD family protein [Desulfarculaceae bacterium]|nr:YceD family protein [Desulfarculaceae bacterium]MCF8071869.1 YceD family protein [Desulfarculaceae bacterium]MCF8101419.1 YceD family protein [Desulfarculaceae bacterium]MCF8117410.1 YceD family protein [Desulfarculaceae bacterium]